jgi:hypothetical protein
MYSPTAAPRPSAGYDRRAKGVHPAAACTPARPSPAAAAAAVPGRSANTTAPASLANTTSSSSAEPLSAVRRGYPLANAGGVSSAITTEGPEPGPSGLKAVARLATLARLPCGAWSVPLPPALALMCRRLPSSSA